MSYKYTDEDVLGFLEEFPSHGNLNQLFDAVIDRSGSYDFAHAVVDYVRDMKSADPNWQWPSRAVEGKFKIRLGDLKKLIEQRLNEAEGDPAAPDATPEIGDSLDSQVDRYFGEYETEAKNIQTEGKDYRSLVQRLMREAEGDDPTAPAAAVPADDLGGKIGVDKIDVESFANSIVRLIDNYDSLLEVRNTIVRRAKNFLQKSYAPEVVESFENVLREEHGIADGESSSEISGEDFPAPAADRAGASPAGPAGA